MWSWGIMFQWSHVTMCRERPLVNISRAERTSKKKNSSKALWKLSEKFFLLFSLIVVLKTCSTKARNYVDKHHMWRWLKHNNNSTMNNRNEKRPLVSLVDDKLLIKLGIGGGKSTSYCETWVGVIAKCGVYNQYAGTSLVPRATSSFVLVWFSWWQIFTHRRAFN